MTKRYSTHKDAYWYRMLAGLHSQKSENVAIKKSVSEWKQALKKYTEYCMNKILKIMQQIKHGT